MKFSVFPSQSVMRYLLFPALLLLNPAGLAQKPGDVSWSLESTDGSLLTGHPVAWKPGLWQWHSTAAAREITKAEQEVLKVSVALSGNPKKKQAEEPEKTPAQLKEERNRAAQQKESAGLLLLTDGGWLNGNPVSLDDKSLVWAWDNGVQFSFPRHQIAGIFRTTGQPFAGPTGMTGLYVDAYNEGGGDFENGVVQLAGGGSFHAPLPQAFSQFRFDWDYKAGKEGGFSLYFPQDAWQSGTNILHLTSTVTKDNHEHALVMADDDEEFTHNFKLKPNAVDEVIPFTIFLDVDTHLATVFHGKKKVVEWKPALDEIKKNLQKGGFFINSDTLEPIQFQRLRLVPWDGEIPKDGEDPRAPRIGKLALHSEKNHMDPAIRFSEGQFVAQEGGQEKTIPWKEAKGIWLNAGAWSDAARPGKDDRIGWLSLRGNRGKVPITSLTLAPDGSVTLSTASGSTLTLPAAAIELIEFPNVKATPKPADGRVNFPSGEIWAGHVTWHGDGPRLTFSDGLELPVPLAPGVDVFIKSPIEPKTKPAHIVTAKGEDWLAGESVGFNSEGLAFHVPTTGDILFPPESVRYLTPLTDFYSDGLSDTWRWQPYNIAMGGESENAPPPFKDGLKALVKQAQTLKRSGGWTQRASGKRSGNIRSKRPAIPRYFSLSWHVDRLSRNFYDNLSSEFLTQEEAPDKTINLSFWADGSYGMDSLHERAASSDFSFDRPTVEGRGLSSDYQIRVDRISRKVELFMNGTTLGDWKSDALSQLGSGPRSFAFGQELEVAEAPGRSPRFPKPVCFLSRFRMEPCLPAAEPETMETDRIFLRNGDRINGTVQDIDATGIGVQTDLGKLSVTWNKIESLFPAQAKESTHSPENPAEPWTRFRIGAAGVVTAKTWQIHDGVVWVESPWTGGTIKIPAGSITGFWIPSATTTPKKPAKPANKKKAIEAAQPG